VVLEQFEFIGSYSKKSDIFATFLTYFAGGDNGLLFEFFGSELACCTKTYVVDFCIFLFHDFSVNCKFDIEGFLRNESDS